MSYHDEKYLKWMDRQGVARPAHDEHGLADTEDNPLSEQLKKYRLNTKNWRLEGNQLICDTEQGRLVQSIPPSHILIGEENGLPVFREVKLQEPPS